MKKSLIFTFIIGIILLSALAIIAVSKNNATNVVEDSSTSLSEIDEDLDDESSMADLEDGGLDNDKDVDYEESSEDSIMQEENEDPTESVANSAGGGNIDEMLKRQSLEMKVSQLFIATPEALKNVKNGTATGENIRYNFEMFPVSGIICMKADLKDPVQTKKMLHDMQKYSRDHLGLPMLIGVDEEGGTVARIASNSAYGVRNVGNMSEIGDTGDAGKAYAAGKYIGSYLSDLGFNLDFAPVADIINVSNNKLMEKRAFGTDESIVSQMAVSMSKGLKDSGVLSCPKHFPGHGNTVQDSHKEYAVSYRSMAELQKTEIMPFKAEIDNGIRMIMVGHISLPKIIGDMTPSSLSPKIVQGLLRGKMGYDGVVITDAINMGAISDHYEIGEAAVLAIKAGCDLILMPSDLDTSREAIIQAVESGIISEKRIDESLKRIYRLKLKQNSEGSENIEETADNSEGTATEETVIENTETSIGLDPSWEFADFSKIHGGSATLYRADESIAKGITVCINAGHGTSGGEKVKTQCHPDGSPKVTGGTTAQGRTTASAVSSGTTMLDGTPEAKVTLKVALAAKKVLLEKGYNVLMIRETDDVQLDNVARTVIANNSADCHIAIHYDSSTSDKGAFFCSVPDDQSYRSMEPVRSNWQAHDRLGKSVISGFKSMGIKISGSGEVPIDLTQTSFSTVPSIDLEVGDRASDYSDAAVSNIAAGIAEGVDIYYN